MKQVIALITLAFAFTAFAAEPVKKEEKKPAVTKKAEAPKAPPSGTKPTPKKKVEAK